MGQLHLKKFNRRWTGWTQILRGMDKLEARKSVSVFTSYPFFHLRPSRPSAVKKS
jgi:hypothetical protein